MRTFASSRMLAMLLGAAMTAACGDDGGSGDGGSGGTGGGTGGTGARDGGGGSGGGGAGGAGARDGGGTAGDGGGSSARYRYILIVDDEKTPMCTGTGPGADIDSISLIRGGSLAGVGLKGSAMVLSTVPGATSAPCSMCGGAACPYSGPTAAARAEGVRDGMSVMVGMDMGYLSLNAGGLWLQIGNMTGDTPAQDIMSGDTIKVWEVDKGYITDMRAPTGCACTPEKYAVYAYVTMGDTATRVQLSPFNFVPANMTECGTMATGMMLGCGTTDFRVP
jgi:hypothetical protein